MPHPDEQQEILSLASSLAKAAASRWSQPDQTALRSHTDDLTESPADHQELSAVLWNAADDLQSGPVLTSSLPWLSAACSARWVENRLFWWPTGIPNFRCSGIASSRIGRQLHRHRRWFDLLRTAVSGIDRLGEGLCIVSGTAAGEAVYRAARLWNLRTVRFVISRTQGLFNSDQAADWILHRLAEASQDFRQSIHNTAPGSRSDQAIDIASVQVRSPDQTVPLREWTVYVSPPWLTDTDLRNADRPETDSIKTPIADRLQFAAASRLYVLHCRRHGTIERLICRHVSDVERFTSRIFLSDDLCSAEMPHKIRESLGSGPLVRWIVTPNINLPKPENRPSSSRNSGEGPNTRAEPSDTIIHAEDFENCRNWTSPLQTPDDWLLHWTRACDGPWPDQTLEEWLDQLILRDDRSDRSALATLLKIVTDGQILGSAAGIRGGYLSVSFTAVPLSEFRQRKVFRRHRQRFDFEPWGVAVRRSTLVLLGAQPVLYGTDSDWHTLTEQKRPWFQKRTEGHGSTNNVAEQEWRIPGDLDLQSLPVNDVCYFVDSEADRRHLRQRTASRVIVVPQPHHHKRHDAR